MIQAPGPSGETETEMEIAPKSRAETKIIHGPRPELRGDTRITPESRVEIEIPKSKLNKRKGIPQRAPTTDINFITH